MSKHKVVEGATCSCKLSEESLTDILKVKTQSKHFGNDKACANKLLVSTKDIGKTLEKNTFGKCTKQPLGNGQYNLCSVDITKWSGFYEKITLSNQGKILLEDSKATCSMGTPDCIEIINHGQIAEPSVQNFKRANPDVQNKINPLLGLDEVEKEKPDFNGIEQM
ncbi:DUF4280 domain-containing protein [uncultured Flavobacterium sp.]|uniref:DUF4280 domain-containing protein n=1 Tax=uncultured Flavobacterium sp. TaxID=165435 RepID=UPI0025CC22BD|nr:DUF4280 domain-containing protein [uncultured Flavobacterium sp.]